MYFFTLRNFLTAGLILVGTLLSAQTVHVVSNSGLAFSPDAITITVGDTVDWQIGGSHNAVEVSQATYDNDGSTPLSGGFETPFGGGKVAFDQVGTFYYVCSPHASQGMKGTITVEEATTDLPQVSLSVDLSVATLAVGRYQLDWSSPMPGETTVEVMDLQGRTVQQHAVALRQGKASLALDLTALPRGYYLVELRQAGLRPVTTRVIR